MTTATMTLLGLYNYRPDLFDLLTLPAGIDKDTCVDNILMRADEMEVLYPDPDFMHDAIGLWSKKWARTFSKWYTALSISYDPLNNYDRHEEWTDDGTKDTNGKSTVSGSTTDKSSASVENKISAYNSSTMQPDTSSSSSGSGQSTLSNENKAENNEKTKNVRKGRAYGNIGVTTSQQMLREELSVAEWNLYDQIADIFLKEFIIPVY